MDNVCTIAIIITLIVLAYLIVSYMKMSNNIEGLTTEITAASTMPIRNSASNAQAYAAAILAQTQILKDQILISQYQTDYEAIIINLEEYINMQMIKSILSINNLSSSNAANSLMPIAMLKQAKEALNDIMVYINPTAAIPTMPSVPAIPSTSMSSFGFS